VIDPSYGNLTPTKLNANDSPTHTAPNAMSRELYASSPRFFSTRRLMITATASKTNSPVLTITAANSAGFSDKYRINSLRLNNSI